MFSPTQSGWADRWANIPFFLCFFFLYAGIGLASACMVGGPAQQPSATILINLTSTCKTNSCFVYSGYGCSKKGGKDHLMSGSLDGGLGGQREASGGVDKGIGGPYWLGEEEG